MKETRSNNAARVRPYGPGYSLLHVKTEGDLQDREVGLIGIVTGTGMKDRRCVGLGCGGGGHRSMTYEFIATDKHTGESEVVPLIFWRPGMIGRGI